MIAWLLVACGGEPALPPSDARHIVVVIARGLETAGPRLGTFPIQGRVEPASTDTSVDQRAWLTGMWPSSLLGGTGGSPPNTLPQVLQLYGYRALGLLGPGMIVGADASRFDHIERSADPRCPDAWIPNLHTIFDGARLKPTLLVVDTAVSACADWDASLGAFLDTLQPVLGRALVVAGAAPGSAGLLAISVAGQEPRKVLAQTTDMLPTLLGFAGAVVPTDAQGTALSSSEVGEGRPTFTLDAGSLVVRAAGIEIRLDRPADGWPVALPDAAPAELRATRDGAPIGIDDKEVVRLWPVTQVWYGRMRATDARTRMGNAAFEKMLRDQGYW